MMRLENKTSFFKFMLYATLTYFGIMNEEGLIKQLEQKVKLNEEIISNLKEFFGTYLSNFLKEYRDNEKEHDAKLDKILICQDRIFRKFHELMKES